MNVPTVHSAVIRMTLIAPMTAAPPNTMPGVMTSLPPPEPDALPSWPNRSLRVLKTPSPERTPNRIPTATIQMKNSAIDSTSEILNADQMSMCRSCRRARRGPRPAALAGRPGRPPAAGAPVRFAGGAWVPLGAGPVGPGPVGGGPVGALATAAAGAAPVAGPPGARSPCAAGAEPVAGADPVVGAFSDAAPEAGPPSAACWARTLPVVGMAWVESDASSSGASTADVASPGAEPSPVRDPVRTE